MTADGDTDRERDGAEGEAGGSTAEGEGVGVEERGEGGAGSTATDTNGDPEWVGLLDYLRSARGFDFHGYKPTSLARRVRKRMAAVGVERFAAYQDYLEVHPDEFPALFDTILINVTSFFRDPETWEVLRDVILPEIARNKGPDEGIRAWTAGCASGEEAYTLAIVMAEALGMDQFRDRVKIYATDLDEEALNTARHAAYPPRQLEGVAPPLLDKYFERADTYYVFRKDLRRQVIFGRHDLINDAPISRVDLLTCRNTLMYLNAETQARVLSRFQFALNQGGYLVLGRAETMMSHAQTFVPVDLKRRISRKASRPGLRERPMPPTPAIADPGRADPDARIRAAALDASPVAQLVVDNDGKVAAANERARNTFAVRPGDVGRPLQDLQLSYRPVELRSLIERAVLEQRPVVVREIEWPGPAGEPRWFDLTVTPLLSAAAESFGASVAFTDVTAHRRLQRELEHSHQELETAYEELQSTNEELETTNEELQSTVEELETTNEELQSTNEELETMNEELQSTNEELHTMNDELRQRTDELNAANAFLESVLTSLRAGVAVVDRELRLLSWNRQAEDLWGVRPDEVVGQNLLNLDIGLPLEKVRPALRSCLAGEQPPELVLDAVNRRGRTIRCAVACTPLLSAAREVRGAIVAMEDTRRDGRGETGQ